MMKTKHLIIPILLAAAYLSMARLDNTYFWDDEALVGIVAKNLIQTGHLTGWDGRNLLAFRNGSLLDDDLRPAEPPLSYLLAAGSFKLLGISTWNGRLPFVLVGLASLIVFIFLMREEFGHDSPLWIYASVAFSLSVVFLLNIRQCRYHSSSILFSLLTFLAYRKCIQTKKVLWFVFFAVASALLFYAHFMICAAMLAAIAVLYLVFHRRQFPLAQIWKVLLTIALFAAATVPYAVYYRIWHRPDIPVGPVVWYIRKPTLLWWNLRDSNLTTIMPWLIAAGLVYIVIRYRKKEKSAAITLEYALLYLAYVVFLSMLSPQPVSSGGIADVRYLTAIMPFPAAMIGATIWFIHRRTKVAAVAVLATVLTTNVLCINPWHWQFRWLLPAYVKEIHQDYPTPYSEAAKFLLENARKDDVVMAFPDWTNYPIMFYAGDKVKLGCLLNRRTHLPVQKVAALQAPLYVEENFPDWFIAFGTHSQAVKLLQYFSRTHAEQGQFVQHRYELARAIDIFWLDMSRPELPWHNFGPKRDFNKQVEGVYALKRVQ